MHCNRKHAPAASSRVLIAALTLLCLGGPVHAGHDDEEPVNLIAPEQVKRLLDVGEKITFIDLRPVADFGRARLPGARSIPVAELSKRLSEVPKAGRVVLYCPCPMGRSDETFTFLLLRKEGYRNISVLDGGYGEWVKRRYPVQAGPP